MIVIQKSKTADTRSCDFANVTKETLLSSSEQHISDVKHGLRVFEKMLASSAVFHDFDKLEKIDEFHADFITGFKNTTWWDNHRKKHSRHHLLQDDGVPSDVNLIDVLELIVDCVMAGMGRTGTVYPVEIKADVLKKAFDNTVELLKNQVEVKDELKAGVV